MNRTHERRWGILAVLMLALLTIGIDNTILNVALPTLATDLEASSSQLQWIVEAYVLAFAGALLTAGALGDRFGRRRALLGGLTVFGGASVAAAFVGSPAGLITLRAILGIGGAFIMPATLSILTHVFPEEERAKAIGIWSSVWAIGIVVGPITGGWLLEHFWWGSVFLVNVPIAVAAIAATIVLVPESSDPAEGRLDPVGAVLSTGGLTALLYGIIQAPEHGWTTASTITAFVAALILMAGFVVWESRREDPMLDVSLFRDPRFSAASAAVTLVMFALVGGMFFLTQHLQFVLGYTPLQAGLRLIPVAVALAVAAPQSAALAKRFGTRTVVAVGLATAAAGLLILSGASVDSGYGIVAATMLVAGAGIGLAGTPATDSIMGAVPEGKAGVGSAVNDTTREVGGALGIAVLGTVLSSAYTSVMGKQVSSLPGEAAEIAADSIGGAVHVAAAIGGTVGDQLLLAARTAFVDAMSTTVLVGAAVALVGAVVAFVYLPARDHDRELDASTNGPALDTVPEFLPAKA